MKCLTALANSTPAMAIDGLAQLSDHTTAVILERAVSRIFILTANIVNNAMSMPAARDETAIPKVSFLFPPDTKMAQNANTPETAIKI